MKVVTPLALAVALCLGSALASAQTVWSGSGNGYWSSSGNWSAGVPLSNGTTTATFNSSSTSTSTVDASYSIASLSVLSGAPALTLYGSGGAVLTFATGISDSSSSSLTIGSGLGLAGTQGNGVTGFGITGGGAVTIYSTNNTYTGDTSITSGSLSDGAANAYSAGSLVYLGSLGVLNVNYNETIGGLSDTGGSGGTVNLASGTRLVVSGNYTSTFSGVIAGQGGLEKNGSSTLILAGANTYSGATSVGSGATLQIGNGGTTGSIQSSGVSGAGGLSFNLSSNYTYAGALTGSLGVAQHGSGTVTLSGANTYTGATTVTAGTLQAGAANAFGGIASTDIVTINGSGILDLNNYNVSVGSVSSSSGSSSITLGSGTLTIANTGSSESFAGVISGTGSLSSAAYQFSLNNANTYSGGTTVTGGTLLVQNATGSGIGTGPLTIQSGAAFQFGNGSTGGYINASSTITDNGTLVVYKTNSLTLANSISGSGVLNKSSSGGLVLSGSNSYSGDTTINAGTLADGAANSFSPNSALVLPSGSGGVSVNYNETVAGLVNGSGAVPVSIATSATLTLSPTASYSSDFAGSISGGGKVVISGGVQGLSGNNTYSGGTRVTSEGELYLGSSNAIGSGTLTFDGDTEFAPDTNVTLSNAVVLNGSEGIDNDDGSGNLTLLGVVSGTNGFMWCTSGTFTLSGNNSFQGGIDMREGTLLLGNDYAAGTGTITLDTSTTLAASGGPGVVRSIANPISVTGYSATFGNNDNNTLILTGGITGNSDASIYFNGGSNGNLTITQPTSADSEFVISSGTVTVGNNTALGPTYSQVLLNGGVGLNVRTGVTVSNPLVFSGTGNVLSGSGTISTAITDDSTAVISPSASPGNGPGTLTFSGGLTLATGGTISLHLYDANGSAGSGYGLISATGGLSLTASPGTITFKLISIDSGGNAANATNFNPANSYSWMFASSSSAISGFDPSDFSLNTSGFSNATNAGSFSFTESGNALYLNFTPVPEPSTWILMGLGGLAVVPVLIRRRRPRAA